jgi:glutamine amidotransferase
MIVIVDYGAGNLRSVQKACEHLKIKVKVTDLPADIKKAEKIVFPGVGHFAAAVKELKKRKLFDTLIDEANKNKPLLGICVGMQLLFEGSAEAPGIAGLGLIKGFVPKFNEKKVIVPHMGWNSIDFKAKNKLFSGIKNNSYFYFAHSFYCAPKEEVTLSRTDYDNGFVSSVNKGKIWGVQFHPEKSQALGLKVLKNFLTLCE